MVVNNTIEPILVSIPGRKGAEGIDITGRIMEFIGKIKIGVLGVAGLVMLIYTAVSVITKIEDSMNIIWKIRKGRSIARRLSDYITTLIVGPVLLFAAFGITATLSSNTLVSRILDIEPLGTIFFAFGKVIPFVFVIIVFTVIYIIIPNTKVRVKSALTGGVAAGIAWHATSWVFHLAVASSTRYAAIYSSLAVLVIFMIWLYLNWLIVLVGAELTFCHQNLKFLTLRTEVFNLSTKLKEKLSLIIMYLIGYNYFYDLGRWTLESLTERLRLPHEPIEEAVNDLTQHNLIIETADVPPCFVPSRALENITLKEIIDAARTNYETDLVEKKYLSMREVDIVTGKVESAIDEALGRATLKDLVESSHKAGD